MLLEEIAGTSEQVAGASARRAKVDRLASCLRRLSAAEVPPAVAYLSGELPHGSIGVGWRSLQDMPPPAALPSVELLEADGVLRTIQETAGPGSQAARRHLLEGLFSRLIPGERVFLTGLLLGELRQGALQGVMADAVAKAAEVPVAEVRRAAMLNGDLGAVAAAAMTSGRGGLEGFRLEIFKPVQPMLAQSAANLPEALGRISPALLEWKLDGARIQAHRSGDRVRIYTRNLADITERVPELVTGLLAMRVDAIVLDGEAIALRPDGRPHPFQRTMSRFGSKLAVEDLSKATPLSGFWFDCLHLDGVDLLDMPANERLSALWARVPNDLLINRILTGDLETAERFLAAALAGGHEGVMVKSSTVRYKAGRRGTGWIKVKVAHTLDLVVLAAEWGHGRRRGRLSNLHLGARDPVTGSFVMLGKTFKGLTAHMLAWQTQHLQQLEVRREGITVFVRPELVVEIAFDGIQVSTRYPGNMALRFARVKGYRPDKRPEEADTIATVRAILQGNPIPDQAGA
ncbi:MAG: ATP-dependent DNA ligase [Actinomycetota bacterium]|nr:ATP-dependent DNA ligase [Actinomycetota bacterium]